MERVALHQLSIHDRTGLELLDVEFVDSVDGKGGRGEVVMVVEGAVEMAFVVLFDFSSEFGLVRPVDAPRKYRVYDKLLEPHRHHVLFVRLYLNVIQWVVRVPLHSRVQHRHLALML